MEGKTAVCSLFHSVLVDIEPVMLLRFGLQYTVSILQYTVSIFQYTRATYTGM